MPGHVQSPCLAAGEKVTEGPAIKQTTCCPHAPSLWLDTPPGAAGEVDGRLAAEEVQRMC